MATPLSTSKLTPLVPLRPQLPAILVVPKDLRQHHLGVVINRLLQPAWVAFVADKRPHLIPLGFTRLCSVNVVDLSRLLQFLLPVGRPFIEL